MNFKLLSACFLIAHLFPFSSLKAEQTLIYVTSSDGNVYVIDDVTLEVIDTIPMGSTPSYIAASASGKVLVSCSDNRVNVIDVDTNEIVHVITAITTPQGIAVNNIDEVAYIVSPTDSSIVVIDLSTYDVQTSIPVNLSSGMITTTPVDVAFSSMYNRLYVAGENELGAAVNLSNISSVTLISTFNGVHNVKASSQGNKFVFSGDSRFLPYGIASSGTFGGFFDGTVAGTYGLAISPNGTDLLATRASEPIFLVFNMSTTNLDHLIGSSAISRGACYTLDGLSAYIAETNGNKVGRYETTNYFATGSVDITAPQFLVVTTRTPPPPPPPPAPDRERAYARPCNNR